MTPEAEELFRATVGEYWELVGTGQEQNVKEFARGMLWGMAKVIEACGHKVEVEQIIESTAKEVEKELRGAGFFSYLGGTEVAARTKRLMKALR